MAQIDVMGMLENPLFQMGAGIASGRSPSFIQNVARGSMGALSNLQAMEQQKIDNRLKAGKLAASLVQDPTTKQQDYAFYVRQTQAAGKTPASFEEWDRANRRSGATTINTAGKLPANYRWRVPGDPTQGVELIPGYGTAEERTAAMTAEAASPFFDTAYAEAENLDFSDAGIHFANAVNSFFSADGKPSTVGQYAFGQLAPQYQRYLTNNKALSDIIATTIFGKAASEAERRSVFNNITVLPTDTSESKTAKINNMKSYQKTLMARGANILSNKEAQDVGQTVTKQASTTTAPSPISLTTTPQTINWADLPD